MDSTLDEAIREAGGVGRYQIVHGIMISLLSKIFYFWPYLALVFTGYYNDHHCRIPENSTLEEWIPTSESVGGNLKWDSCLQYAAPNSNETLPCQNGYEYDPSGFHATTGTIVMEWDLVCTQSSAVGTFVSLLMLGMLAGSFLGGSIADKIGRRKTFLANLILVTILSVSIAASPNPTFFGAATFIEGIFVAGSFCQGLVIISEIFPKDDVKVAIPMAGSIAGFAYLILVALAYFIRQWRYLQLTTALLPLLFLPYFKFCPESLSWLVANDRIDEAEKILAAIAQANGKAFKSGRLEALKTEETVSTLMKVKIAESDPLLPSDHATQTTYHLLKRMLTLPKCRFYMVAQWMNQLIFYMLNLSIMYMAGKLSGNIYVNSALSAIIGSISTMAGIPVLRRVSCRKFVLMCYAHVTACAALSIFCTVAQLPGVVSTLFLLLTRLGEAGGFQGSTVYMQDMLPVNVRSTIMNIGTGFGCMGSIIGAYVGITLMQIEKTIAIGVLGILAAVGFLLTYPLPDTSGKRIPQSAEEIEAWTEDKKI